MQHSQNGFSTHFLYNYHSPVTDRMSLSVMTCQSVLLPKPQIRLQPVAGSSEGHSMSVFQDHRIKTGSLSFNERITTLWFPRQLSRYCFALPN